MTRIYTLASSSSGNCILVSIDGCHILVDAGISCRRIVQGLSAVGLGLDDISALLLTHSHSDHIGGINTLCKRCGVPLYATRDTAAAILTQCPAADGRIGIISDSFRVGEVEITAFSTPHDCHGSVCYRLGNVGVMTDLGYVPPKLLYGMEGVTALVLESNHDVFRLMSGPYPYPLKQRILSDHGHLSNEDSAEAAAWFAEKGTRCFILAHLSKENNTPELARQAAEKALAGFENVRLYIAPPETGEPVII